MRKYLWPLFVFAFLTAPGGLLWAQRDDGAATLKGLSERYKALSSITAQYSRTTVTPSSGQLFKSGASQTAAGRLSWSLPAKLLLDQQSPQPETMVTDGLTVWWFVPAQNLVYLYKNINVAGQIRPLLAFLSGLDELSREFKVKAAPSDPNRPGQRGLLLTPKNTEELGLDQLTVWCDREFTLTGFRLKAATGEETDFYLTGLAENPELDGRIFSFVIPGGVEVQEETGEGQ